MNIRIEIWNGHEIRFVEYAPGEWGAIAKDVFQALDVINTPDAIKRIDPAERRVVSIYSENCPNPDVNVLTEFGVYEAIFSSRKKAAKAFKRWVFDIIKSLREASGLEAFQVFRMLDKEHQKEAMKRLREGLRRPVRVDFIKANTIANKAVSTRHGYEKMVKKDQMTPDMLVDRQPILDDTVGLMGVNDSFDLGLRISDIVYGKYVGE